MRHFAAASFLMEAFTAWVAFAGAVWFLFAIAEHLISPVTRQQIHAWLAGHTPVSQWSTTFVAMCDEVFHTPHLTERSFWRASLASHLTAMLLMCFAGVVYPGASMGMMFLVFLYAPLLIASLALINLLPGYLALLSTRLLVSWWSRQQRPGRSWLCCLAYGLSTCFFSCLGCALGFAVMRGWGYAHSLRGPLRWLNGYVDHVLASGGLQGPIILDILRLQPVVVPGVIFPSFGIWFYAPCFATVYLCLYVLSGLLLRGLGTNSSPASWFLLFSTWDIQARPVQTLGTVATLVGSLAYWSVLLGLHYLG